MLLVVLALFLPAGNGVSQTADISDQERAATQVWDQRAAKADQLLSGPEPGVEALQDMQAELSLTRAEARSLQKDHEKVVEKLNERIAAIGPAPENGGTEPREIQNIRADLEQKLLAARAPVQRSLEAYQRANSLIEDVDALLIARFSSNIVSHGPVPVLPKTWLSAARELGSEVRAHRELAEQKLNDPGVQSFAVRRVPVNLLVIIAGFLVIFSVRRRLSSWLDHKLRVATSPRPVAWLQATRNLTRLIVPAFGVALVFSALSPVILTQSGRSFGPLYVPVFAVLLIAAGWLSDSLFSQRSRRYRILPLSDAEARSGSKITIAAGCILALKSLSDTLISSWELTHYVQAVLYFPLVVLGSLVLWQIARIIRLVRVRIGRKNDLAAEKAQIQNQGINALDVLVRVLIAVSVVAPVLAAIGYMNAAAFLLFPMILTVGLAGVSLIVFHLLSATTVSLVSARQTEPGRPASAGLIPVVIGILVALAALPLLALAWGARGSDLAAAWLMLAHGFSVGGVTLSPGSVLTFIVVFAVFVAATRLLQSLVKGLVLPQTHLDAGGRNAILTGISYVGYILASLFAVTAAGFDLSGLAIVAGALSVGIGFGLQTIVSNFVSGIILLIERPIKEGDWIEVAGFSGYVKGIKVRSTEIETFDQASVIVPNADLVAGVVLNRTHTNMSGRLEVPISVAYDSDPQKIERILTEIIESHPLVLEDPAPAVLMMGFSDGGMNFEIRCYLRDVNYVLTVKSDMYYEICERFREENITIPYPQRDLHIRTVGDIADAFSSGKENAGET